MLIKTASPILSPPEKTGKTQSRAKRNFYKWHRVLGLMALVPVIFWTISGLSHPFMSNWFRPFIPQEVFKPKSQAAMQPQLSIQEVMDRNHLTEIMNFNLLNFDRGTFYQVLNRDSIYQYYSADNGNVLPNGDRIYAVYLARYFTGDKKSPVKEARLQTSFDRNYQPINHLLPVWKVSFNRPDGMDIYVETSQSRLATFNNNTRKAFLWVFEQFHTWQFLAAIGGEKFRIIVLLIIVSVMFLSLLSGLTVYGLFWKRFKAIQQKRKTEGREDKRFLHRFHRQIGLIVSFVLFTFVTSGAFHLLVKLHNIGPSKINYSQIVNRKELILSNLKLSVPDSTIKKIAVVRFQNRVYYQVLNDQKQILYFDAANGQELQNGDQQYAAFISNFYRSGGHQQKGPQQKLSITQIRQFDNEYGFINKRLPVEKISYPGQENWYIETTTSKLATTVAGIDRAEGLSFIFLHKYFGMTWAGKDVRDLVSMLSALGVLVVSLFGFASFISNKSA
ncbi:PepSY-associated TM helix domain-containing protein [Mucilaginibacter arboris]|uniref:PepSY domain-containing protein n=1 Tax=Mucilaginibacter arboris TaxID=2682090 RepID=A0A7K1SU24_9SPHI|nr:PepSY-associated TM helix domain-containing protein [Mucilaginibacter arboris]MVN20794.1 PepSY domain-containing protein [Mucilaginibacter arboris]